MKTASYAAYNATLFNATPATRSAVEPATYDEIRVAAVNYNTRHASNTGAAYHATLVAVESAIEAYASEGENPCGQHLT